MSEQHTEAGHTAGMTKAFRKGIRDLLKATQYLTPNQRAFLIHTIAREYDYGMLPEAEELYTEAFEVFELANGEEVLEVLDFGWHVGDSGEYYDYYFDRCCDHDTGEWMTTEQSKLAI